MNNTDLIKTEKPDCICGTNEWTEFNKCTNCSVWFYDVFDVTEDGSYQIRK